MCRSIAALLFAGCLTFQVWAQTPPPQQPATQSPAAAPAPAEPAASTSQPSQFPLDQFKEFSAIMAGGPVPGTEDEIHIYRSGNLMRMEANDGRIYHITDLVKHESHGLARTGCLKYANSYIRSYPFSFSGKDNTFERVPVGKETVDGHVCQVEDVTISFPKNPTQAKIRLWEAEDLQGFPIKVETRGGPKHRTILYKNVVLGPQDPTLFIFPDTCQNSEKTIGKTKLKPSSPKKPPTGKSQ
ncbi:MAG: hypothetical protein LAO30_16100 [Acidobacteriia bacterium]|nr:hypothetical protein [Terriglobia bacterium]